MKKKNNTDKRSKYLNISDDDLIKIFSDQVEFSYLVDEYPMAALTEFQRLNYLVLKYFKSQKEFADKAKLNTKLVNDYLNGKTKSISLKSLARITANVGFSQRFIKFGIGNELNDGIDIKPLLMPNTLLTLPNYNKSVPIRYKLENGDAKCASLEMSGKNMVLLDEPIRNIVDIAFSKIQTSPLIVRVTDPPFCNKYNIKPDSFLIIDEGIYFEGSIVLLCYNRKYYICEFYDTEYFEGEYQFERFFDIVKPENEIHIKNKDVNFHNIEGIIGAIHCKIEKF